jgi:cobalt/nickel transport system permease protein
MHMADALVSPAVGGTLWATSAGLLGWCARQVRQTADAGRVPMMGVLGAFIFAAQMINFSIPGTGSSGHLGGGLILAILLGPAAAFVVLASVLTVQALFFADGGLLALGCNIINLGFFPAFVAYPFFYTPIVGAASRGARFWIGAMLAAVVGLQLGAFGVVLETTLSGISDLPFRTFVLLMQPIHLGIGLVEGLATAAVVAFVQQARPTVLAESTSSTGVGASAWRRIAVGLLLAAAGLGGAVCWFASTRPDGLEWAVGKARGDDVRVGPGAGVPATLARIQERTAVLPDYGFRTASPAPVAVAREPAPWPAVSAGTSVAGLVGGLLTLLLAGLIGLVLTRRSARGGSAATEST